MPCSQDLPCIRWREGCGIQAIVTVTGMVLQVLGCGNARKCVLVQMEIVSALVFDVLVYDYFKKEFSKV